MKKGRCLDLCPPPLGVLVSDLFGEDDKEEKDEETLEGHHDSVDVSKG